MFFHGHLNSASWVSCNLVIIGTVLMVGGLEGGWISKTESGFLR